MVSRKHNAFAEESIKSTMQRDQIKRSRCKELGITLIEIPYWIPVKDLEDYIKKAL